MPRASTWLTSIEGAPMTSRRLPVACAMFLASGVATAAAPDLANPAAVLCAKNGATVTNEAAPNGAQRGICVFPNGTRIDEWAYFRNKHRTLH